MADNITHEIAAAATLLSNSTQRVMTSSSDGFHPLSLTTVHWEGVDASPWHTSEYKTAILTSFAVIMSLITMLANMTIIILSYSDKKIRKMNSYFIINLACMDFIVGLFVIPCMAAYNILGYWPLGNIICDIWTCVDSMCCTASFFNLCVISWDRFLAITKPLQHRSQDRGNLKKAWLIMLPWLASGLSWVPAIIAWRIVLGYAGDGECIYLTDKYYVLLSNIFVYCIPMIAIIYLYLRVWYAVRSQMNDLLQVEEKSTDNDVNDTEEDYALDNIAYQDDESKPEGRPHQVLTGTTSNNNSVSTVSHHRRPQPYTPDYSSEMSSVSFKELSPSILRRMSDRKTLTGKEMERARLKKHHLARMMTHKRRPTAKTLGIIVVVFLICWMPWAILYPLNGFCRCVPNWMYIACYWTAYLNSTFNPFLYGFNRDFRKVFKRIILDRFRCRKMK